MTVSFRVLLMPMPSRRVTSPERSLAQHNERLAFFDDVGGELRRVAAPDIFRCVDRSGRDEQDLAALSVTGGSPSS